MAVREPVPVALRALRPRDPGRLHSLSPSLRALCGASAALPAGHAGPPQEPRPGPPPGILPRRGGTPCPGCTPVPDRNRMPRARWQLVRSEQRSGEQGASSLASPARGRPRPPALLPLSRRWRDACLCPAAARKPLSLTRTHGNASLHRGSPVPAGPRGVPHTPRPGHCTSISGPVPGKYIVQSYF